MFKKLSVREIAIASGLSAISAITQLIHIGYQSPQFGMWIDVVAVSWLIAYFLYGFRISFIVSLIGAIVITLFAPETWLGALMKWTASAPMWIFLGLWIVVIKKHVSQYQNLWLLLFPLFIGLLVRCLIVIPLNYYFAIPIWTGLSTAKAMTIIPWYVIALFNLIQGIIDVGLAWIIVYKFKLNRFVKKNI
jgi:riboflavin transporter